MTSFVPSLPLTTPTYSFFFTLFVGHTLVPSIVLWPLVVVIPRHRPQYKVFATISPQAKICASSSTCTRRSPPSRPATSTEVRLCSCGSGRLCGCCGFVCDDIYRLPNRPTATMRHLQLPSAMRGHSSLSSTCKYTQGLPHRCPLRRKSPQPTTANRQLRTVLLSTANG